VLGRLVQYDVCSLTSTPPTLEEIFLRHYGDQLDRSQCSRRCEHRAPSQQPTSPALYG
jgi:hypothetical protein